MSTLYSITRSLPHVWVGPVPDASDSIEHKISKLLYPRLDMKTVWTPPINAGNQEQTTLSISDLDYSHDGKALVASSADQNVYVFDPNNGKLRHTLNLEDHKCSVTRVCWLGGPQFVSGYEDSAIALWDLRKANKPVNTLLGHASAILGLEFDKKSELLLSLSMDHDVRYWHIPTFQSTTNDQNEDTPDTSTFRGILPKCPLVKHFCLHQDSSTLVLVNSHSTLFVIYNLNIMNLCQNFKYLCFDESLSIQLGWINPNVSMAKPNRIRILNGNDYCPGGHGIVTKVSSIQFHPSLPLLMTRLSMSATMGLVKQSTEWSCVVNIRQSLGNAPMTSMLRKNFGSDVLEETLLYLKEEKRSGIIERKHSFSKCGRVILSPGKKSISMLAFSPDFKSPYDNQSQKWTMSNLFKSAFTMNTTAALTVVKEISFPEGVVTAKFSPCDILFATGLTSGTVKFYQPVI